VLSGRGARRALAAALAVAAACVLPGCFLSSAHRAAGGILAIDVPNASGPAGETDRVKHAGTMTVGERLEIRLGASAGTGYSWMLAGPVPANMQMTSGDKAGAVAPQEGTEPRPGGPTWTVFGMNAVAQGEASLRFVLVRPWEKESRVPPAREVEVTVTVKPRE
jgi:predicted secreted protein